MVAKQDNRAHDTGIERTTSRIIADLNDAFRHSCKGGTLAVTSGVIALGRGALPLILEAVRTFDAFTPDSDPYGEHDFGSMAWNGALIFWKIEYYDPDMRYGSADPTDPSVTARVLTIMLAEEY